MNTESIVQRSAEWYAARAGSLGASEVHGALARTKSGWASSREQLLSRLAWERLTGRCVEGFKSPAMQRGIDLEPEARAAYAFFRDVGVAEVGLVRHPKIAGTHASPDGLVGADGLVELKCFEGANHLVTLLSGEFEARYVTQADWQLACTGRAWCDLAAYHPDPPPEMRLCVVRVERDEKRIAKLEDDVREFLAELDMRLSALRAKFGLWENTHAE
jgi:putative phage-type endonuclease